MALTRVSADDVEALQAFLHEADLTVAGLDAPTVRLWVERGEDGAIVGSTGFELSADHRHALIRSVAVAPPLRRAGAGVRLARYALAQAHAAGADRAWLFSRRSGPFWQQLGFTPADRDELASVLPLAHQVRLFTVSGQLEREVAWSRALDGVRGQPDRRG
ncbi:GNAT family N-acetyltransferase [Microbacterium sp. SS28]|uniref:GNAT family N-acetyltransferase n=1 Tax=Microbacterium sp. SS28 TaxID=2919948 RepID=UPI001FA9A6EB|nr:GNAT family N-acetyltransferase [Microbacterium sp. SS28]